MSMTHAEAIQNLIECNNDNVKYLKDFMSKFDEYKSQAEEERNALATRIDELEVKLESAFIKNELLVEILAIKASEVREAM